MWQYHHNPNMQLKKSILIKVQVSNFKSQSFFISQSLRQQYETYLKPRVSKQPLFNFISAFKFKNAQRLKFHHLKYSMKHSHEFNAIVNFIHYLFCLYIL